MKKSEPAATVDALALKRVSSSLLAAESTADESLLAARDAEPELSRDIAVGSPTCMCCDEGFDNSRDRLARTGPSRIPGPSARNALLSPSSAASSGNWSAVNELTRCQSAKLKSLSRVAPRPCRLRRRPSRINASIKSNIPPRTVDKIIARRVPLDMPGVEPRGGDDDEGEKEEEVEDAVVDG